MLQITQLGFFGLQSNETTAMLICVLHNHKDKNSDGMSQILTSWSPNELSSSLMSLNLSLGTSSLDKDLIFLL
jgi:hypothetical protein